MNSSRCRALLLAFFLPLGIFAEENGPGNSSGEEPITVFWSFRTVEAAKGYGPRTEVLLNLHGTEKTVLRVGDAMGNPYTEGIGGAPRGTLVACSFWWAGQGIRYYAVRTSSRVVVMSRDEYEESGILELKELQSMPLAAGATLKTASEVSLSQVEYRRSLKRTQPVMNGDDVAFLQLMLKANGYEEVGSIDGWFGPATETAVVRFQKDNKLTADGVVGPQTWEKLKATLREKQ